MRIIVPDAEKLMEGYADPNGGLLEMLGEVNEGCANSPTPAGKLWALLHEGHQSCYDAETLIGLLVQTGWDPAASSFRSSSWIENPAEKRDRQEQGFAQILREAIDMLPCLSLYVDAVPIID